MVCRRKKDRARNRGTCPTKQNLTSNPNHVKVKGILGHISWENSWCLVAFKRLLALILSHHFRHTHTEVPQMQGPRVVVQLPSLIQLIATPWTAAHQASLSITSSRSLPKFMSIESVMPSNYLILCCPLFLLPSIFPSIRVFSNESALRIRWPKYWSFSFSISPSNEYSWLVSFKIDWFDLLAERRLSRFFFKRW